MTADQLMNRELPASKPVKVLYRPFGMLSGIVGGIIAAQVFRQIWTRTTPGDRADPPSALESEYPWWQVLAAAAAQGAVFAVVKAAIDRAGARAFQRWTGEWPGD
jgi:hypothetical protein